MGSSGNICAICGANYEAAALFCPRDGAPLGPPAPRGPDPLLGASLPGQIRIEKLIGMGSMGRVYRGFQAGIDRAVAVKVLHAELSSDRTVVERFHREARIASLLTHPNAVEVLMTGELPAKGPGAGGLYMVMDYVDGLSLRSALAAAGGALPLPRALRIVLQMCDVVGEAHRLGVVHRDLKPENVMLVRRDSETDFVKVLDFGIARLPAGSAPVVTKAGLILGTARYISPEGAMGTPVDRPADVYAIATILYQALAGRTPFEGQAAVEVLAMQINEPPPPLRSFARASYVPEPLADVIMKNLAKRPERRSFDACALGRSLLDAARESGLSPEALVPSSALLRPSARRPAFVSAEPTQEQEFTVAIADKIEAVAPRPKSERAAAPVTTQAGAAPIAEPSAANPTPTRGALLFLLGCVAGGAGLAALGARFSDSRTPAAATAARVEPAGREASVGHKPSPGSGGADAGPTRGEAGRGTE
jgi:eukaryotic-like serine/threonine-protein kinase